jgi:hypothetical protein
MPKKSLDISKGTLFKTSERFRKLFLIKLTLQLIRHSKVEEFFILEKIIKKRDEKAKEEDEKLEKKYGRGELIPSIMHREPFKRRKQAEIKPLFAPPPAPLMPPPRTPARPIPRGPLRIPEYQLPPTVQHIRPTPTNVQIDLGKLNPLIQDGNVRAIECNGPDENIIVKGSFGSKKSNIILNRDEVNQTLQRFSEASKIPIHEGVFKIVVGRLMLSAIISDVVGSKFIIRKMAPQMLPPSPMAPMPPPGMPVSRMVPGTRPMPRRF